MKKIISVIIITFLLISCWQKEEWRCVVDWSVMYSQDQNWNLWWAQKWCSCEEIENFEMKTFWTVDYDALKSDFGCEY